MCFKPDVYDHPFKPVSCLGKGGKENLLHHSNVFMSLPDGDKSDSSSDDSQEPRSAKSKPRRGFSRVFKAVLSRSSLARRKGSRKSEKETPYRPSKFEKLCSSFGKKKSSSPNKETLDHSLRSDSSRSTLFSSSTAAASSSLTSSRASSVASNSRSASERKRSSSFDSLQLSQKPTTLSKKTNGCCSSNVGLYFLLICLVALIFWGKAFAVFCTSTCLFLIPCRFKRVDDRSGVNVNNSVHVIDVDSEEYKKKVIMEGLLERNNRTSRVL